MSAVDYKIEKIIKDRYSKEVKAQQYLVKWEGYPHSENTWETRDDLLADGYGAALEEYAERMDSSTAKKTPARNARSKTPVKRSERKQVSSTDDVVRKLELDKDTTTAAPAGQLVASTDRFSFTSMLVSTAILTLSVAVAQNSYVSSIVRNDTMLDILPLLVGFALVRTLGKNTTLVSQTSMALVWVAFSRYALNSATFASYPKMAGAINVIWRLFFATAAQADLRDRNVLMVACGFWYMWGDFSLPIFSQLSLFLACWAFVSSVDRFAGFPSTLNLYEAIASVTAVGSFYDDDIGYLWVAFAFLSVTAASREKPT